MPYTNIPESKLPQSFALIIGKLQGELSNKVSTLTTDVLSSVRQTSNPSSAEIAKLRLKKDRLDTTIRNISKRLELFTKLPKSLETPIAGFKAAQNIILALPIPQAVPPGVGIPVSITTKYSDLLRTLKEYTAQAEDNINSLDILLAPVSEYITSIKNISSNLDLALKSYEIQSTLLNELSQDELKSTGLLDASSGTVFGKLVPVFLGTGELINGKVVYTTSTNKNEGTIQDTQRQAAVKELTTALFKLNDSNLDSTLKDKIRGLLDTLKTPTKLEIQSDPKYYYTGPDGTNYKLEILQDPTSPSIAPRRFAIAETLGGVVVIKGEPSFSSDVNVLLDELKFRIDHQLT